MPGDAGRGSRGISQLKILINLLHRTNSEAQGHPKSRPCDVFDMIGGTGSGGFVAILLVMFNLSAEDALKEFIDMNNHVFGVEGMDMESRTAALKKWIEALLKRYDIKASATLLNPNGNSPACKLVVPISYRNNIDSTCTMRNFTVRREPALNLTVAEALLTTLASPLFFTPASIYKDFATFEYTSGDLGINNPTRNILSEAHEAFGSDQRVACLLSLGCGHPGVISAPHGFDLDSWSTVLDRLVTSSEQKAQEIESQMGHLGIYYRYSVPRGFSESMSDIVTQPGDILAHTAVYLEDALVSPKLDMCVDVLKKREGGVSLGNLTRSGGEIILPPALPPLIQTFVMREKEWKFIEGAIFGPRSLEQVGVQRMLAVTGMGGCGKTQIILKFLWVHEAQFASRFFIDGSSEDRIRADLIRHVRSLGIEHSQKSFDECLLFLSQPSSRGQRLIVYDNVDDPKPDTIRPLIPAGAGCIIVFTSRNRSLGDLCPDTHLELDKMTIGEAVELLLPSVTRPDQATNTTREEAVKISVALDCLPIALQQARSYIYQTKCSFSEYAQRLQESKERLLAHSLPYHHEKRNISTHAAFDASFGKLELREQQFLQLISHVHWKDFPLELITLAASHAFSDYYLKFIDHGDEFQSGKELLEKIFLFHGRWRATNLDDIILSSQNYSLVTIVPGVGTRLLQVHPLLHEWVNSRIPEEEQAQYHSAAVLLLALGARKDPTPSLQYLSSHLTHLSHSWDKLSVNSAASFGHILQEGGLFHESLQLWERVVEMLGDLVNPQAVELVNAKYSLSIVYSYLGRFRDAKNLQKEVMALRIEALGECHPDTVLTSNSLAITYRQLGKLHEAEKLHEEVLQQWKKTLGERHPSTITASSDLAVTYRKLGKLNEAERLQKEVLKLREEVLGKRHPDTIMTCNCLGNVYRDLGKLDEAEQFHKEALNLWKEVLGERHPNTVMASHNLARTYSHRGKLDEAEQLQRVLLELREEILGRGHHRTFNTANALATTYYTLGKLDEAEQLQKRALGLMKEVFEERHPETIKASNNLASIYCGQGKLGLAEKLHKEALALSKEVLGERHPDTILVSNSLANTYHKLGRLDEAKRLQEEVLRLRKEVLDEHHPGTVQAMLSLAETYESLKEPLPALQLLAEADLVISKTQKTSHPHYSWHQNVMSRVMTLPGAQSYETYTPGRTPEGL